MKSFVFGVFTLIFLTLISTISHAETGDEGLYGLGGVDLGIGSVSEDVGDKRSGIHTQVKGVLSYYTTSFVFDFGLGWFYNEVDNSSVTTRTKSALVEGSARYRLSERWNIGPIVTTALANDNSFAVGRRKNSSETFVGARVDWEPDFFRANKIRLNATVQQDVTITGRSVTLATVGLQFGFPFKNSKFKIIEKVVYKEKLIPKFVKISNTHLRATFDTGSGFYFTTNSDKANKRMKEYLERLAKVLKKYKSSWRSVEVTGHTDDVGKLSYNMDLSKRRAYRVKKILSSKGINPKKIVTKWYGPKKPVAKGRSETARALNRRVELDFIGIKDFDAFHKALLIIK